jgi:hypothetical protein
MQLERIFARVGMWTIKPQRQAFIERITAYVFEGRERRPARREPLSHDRFGNSCGASSAYAHYADTPTAWWCGNGNNGIGSSEGVHEREFRRCARNMRRSVECLRRSFTYF